jgi:hypothetical protein
MPPAKWNACVEKLIAQFEAIITTFLQAIRHCHLPDSAIQRFWSSLDFRNTTNNVVEQDDHKVKTRARLDMGYDSFRTA